MKKLALFALVLSGVLSGCNFFGGSDGELTGKEDRPSWDSPQPLGMVLVPAGSFHMGQNDQDITSSQVAPTRQITISAFFMDDTEITNNEWRQFETEVKDNTTYAFFNEINKYMIEKYNYALPAAAAFADSIKPDTSRWTTDFAASSEKYKPTYTYNDPIVDNYYWHPAFDNYPVMGVNWYDAQAFCKWRTEYFNSFRVADEKPIFPAFRLPSEAEWEYAARGGLDNKLYPWEGLYLSNSKGCYLANFKVQRGDYIADNYTYTGPTQGYWPNDFGLYDMSGNVAEWCEDDYDEKAYSKTFDMNPLFRYDPRSTPAQLKFQRKVVRGGSWKDIGYFLAVGTRGYEYAETSKSYIGFRCVVSVLGPSGASLQP